MGSYRGGRWRPESTDHSLPPPHPRSHHWASMKQLGGEQALPRTTGLCPGEQTLFASTSPPLPLLSALLPLSSPPFSLSPLLPFPSLLSLPSSSVLDPLPPSLLSCSRRVLYYGKFARVHFSPQICIKENTSDL